MAHRQPSNLSTLQTTAVDTPLAARVQAVVDTAAACSRAVDAEARFPSEAMDLLKANALLGSMVPRSLGGEGVDVAALADICYKLGGACPSTAMIFAMHQIKAACLIRHCGASRWHKAFLKRVASEQLLLASSTTEGLGGGDVRSSAAPVERSGDRIALDRDATVMSYGAQADAVVTTARRTADAGASDQVLVVFTRDQYTLERTSGWDTLGMRGTCSGGFAFHAKGRAAQMLPTPYAAIHAQTMTPVAHLLWAATWAGVAADAVERARIYLRKAMRKGAGQLPPGAPHFIQATSALRSLRSLLSDALARYAAVADEPATLAAADFQTAITLMKVEASELAVTAVMHAMRTCGLTGYRNDQDASLGRHLRDILSAPIMINNDRILSGLGAAPLLTETPRSIWA